MKDKILIFHTFFELHRTDIASVQYSSKITQVMKAKQQKNKAIDHFFLKKTKNNNAKWKTKQL
jgi:sortase (surface protein transpeptidase)